MALISNSPREISTIEVEARKSFALMLRITDARDWPADLTQHQLRFVAAKLDRTGTPTIVLEREGLVTDALKGRAQVNLQAADLELVPADYPFSLTMTHEGYSAVLLKGVLRVVENTEFASIHETYANAALPQHVDIQMRRQADVHVELGNLLPADVLRIPGGGKTGQFLGKPDDDPLSMRWMDLQGGLNATGVPADQAPTSLGDGTWEWRRALGQFEWDAIMQAFAGLGQYAATIDTKATAAQARADDAWDYADTANELAQYALLQAGSAREEAIRRGPTGSVTLYAGETAPTGWVICDGRELSRTSFPTLFNAIGVAYGSGDGSTTFNVPDLRGLTPVGLNAAESEFNVLGKTGGAKTHTLTTAQMPSHAHDFDSSGKQGVPRMAGNDGVPPNVTFWGVNRGTGFTHYMIGIQATAGPGTIAEPTNTHTAGSSQAHNNLQPYMALNYIIKT